MTALLLDKAMEGFIGSVYDCSAFCQAAFFVICEMQTSQVIRLNNWAVEASKPFTSPDKMRA
jgi:hypothetical protein